MKKRHILFSILALAFLFCTASCSKDDNNDDNTITPRETRNRVLNLIGPGVDQYWQKVKDGIISGFDASDIKLEWIHQINANDINSLTSGIQRGIATSDSLLGMIVLPYSTEVEQALQQALNHNIRIVLLEDCDNTELVNACHAMVTTNNAKITDSLCNVVKRNETSGDILYIGQYTTKSSKDRYDRVESTCPTWYGLKTQGEDATKAIDSILNEHNTIQTIVFLNGSTLTSSLYSKISDKHLYAIDLNSVTQQAFDDGNIICLVEQNPTLLGEFAATILRTDKPAQKINYVPTTFHYLEKKTE